MRLFLYEKEEFLDILWLDKKSMISVYYVKVSK